MSDPCKALIEEINNEIDSSVRRKLYSASVRFDTNVFDDDETEEEIIDVLKQYYLGCDIHIDKWGSSTVEIRWHLC
jgi:hypothetical protein